MWFHFCFANHLPLGRLTLFDMLDWFSAGLKECGHKVTFHEYQLCPSAINILWEYSFPGLAEQLKQTNCIYGLIGTEMPDGDGFNQRREIEWRNRWKAFQEVGRQTAFIWTTIESAVNTYSNYAPTSFIELGYSKYLVPNYFLCQPKFDFVFYGLKTPHREKIISEIRKHSKVIWPDHLLLPNEVNTLIGKTKIALLLKQSEDWSIPSPTRLGRLLMARRGIAAERTRVITRQMELIPQKPEGMSFIDFAFNQLIGPWRQQAEESFERYRKKMPMRNIMEKVLNHTIYNNRRVANSNYFRYNKIRSILNINRPCLLVERSQNFNILFFKEKYYVVPLVLGELDLEKAKVKKRNIFTFATLARARKFMKIRENIIKFKEKLGLSNIL